MLPKYQFDPIPRAQTGTLGNLIFSRVKQIMSHWQALSRHHAPPPDKNKKSYLNLDNSSLNKCNARLIYDIVPLTFLLLTQRGNFVIEKVHFYRSSIDCKLRSVQCRQVAHDRHFHSPLSGTLQQCQVDQTR